MLDKIFVNPLYRKHRESMVSFLDLSIVAFAYLLTIVLVGFFDRNLLVNLGVLSILGSFFAILAVYFLSFRIFKVQKSLWKYISSIELVRIGGSVFLSIALLTVIVLVGSINSAWILYNVVGGILTFLSMLIFRVVYRTYRRLSVNADINENIKRAIIIGAGDAGYLLSKEIIQNTSLGLRVVGFIDDKRKDLIISGIPVLGSVTDIPEVKEKYTVTTALIAIPSASQNEMNRIVSVCKDLGLEIKIMRENSLFVDQSGKQRVSVDDISIEDLLGRREVKFETDEVSSYIKNKSVMVTGAGGSIGSELCRQIVKFSPKRLILVDVNENGLYMLEQEFNRHRMHQQIDPNVCVVSVVGSIREKDTLDNIISTYEVEVVYHAAAHKHVPLMETRPMEAIKNNVFGTNNLIHSCIDNKVERLIMISTDKAVNPTNVMGASKRMTEMLLQANGNNGVTKLAAVRFGNVLGSSGSVIPIFKNQIKEGGPITITDKNIKRFFMTIPEASQLVLQAGYYADKGEIFVLDMGDPVFILDLAENMIRLAGLKPYIDIDIVEIGLRPGEKMYEELKLASEITSKTQNQSISKTETLDITVEMIELYLEKLRKVIDDKSTNKVVKDTLLEIIGDVK